MFTIIHTHTLSQILAYCFCVNGMKCATLFSHFNGCGDDDDDNAPEDSCGGTISLLSSNKTVGQIKCDIISDAHSNRMCSQNINKMSL